MDVGTLADRLRSGALDPRLSEIYGEVGTARERLLALVARYENTFPGSDAALFTAAGRTEMGGNHTDHQHGRVLAASVSLDTIACGGANDTRELRVLSEGYPDVVVGIDTLDPILSEVGKAEAIVRGIARGLVDRGYEIGGTSLATTSNVPGGSGLSSSAAFEILVGTALNHLFCNDELTMVELAQIGKFAENVFFGKPSGLMDQMACAVGGIVSIDFADPDSPEWEQVDCDLEAFGHVLCIIDSGADHADLTEDYAAIVQEMGAVASYFDARYLREVPEDAFWTDLAGVRSAAGDRAVLRATHFFGDNARVPLQAEALADGRFDDFLTLVNASGASSIELLQNIYSASAPLHQAVGVTITLARRLLDGRGAVRVHGGGFAGTVQAYVPVERAELFRQEIDAVLGHGACSIVTVRPVGGAVIA